MAVTVKQRNGTQTPAGSNGHAAIRYVAYLRVSSEEQRERGTIQTQLSVLEDYCKREGIRLQAVYKDDGISGTVPFAERPSGRRLLQDARAKQFDCVLLFKFDRLGRNTLESLIAAQTLEGLGVSIKSVTEPFDTSTPAGRFMMTQLASFAQLERENIRERSIAGTNRVVREGKAPPGRPPYGYLIGPDRRLTINETPIPGCDKSEAAVVRLIFRWVAEEHLSLLAIADRLHAMGIPPSSLTEGRKRKPRTGTYAAGVWQIAALSVLIHRTTYKGVYQFGRLSRQPNRELITVTVPAIVPPALWEQAQEALRRNLQWAKRNAHREYLLSALIRCGFCGRRMQALTPTRRRPFYRCGRSKKHDNLLFTDGVCPSRPVPLDWINDLVWEELKNWILNQHDLEAVITEALQEQNQKRQEWEESLARARHDLGQTETQRGRILTLYRKGLMSDADLETQLSELTTETQQLQQVGEELEKRLSFTVDIDTAVVTIRHQLESFRAALHKKTVPFLVKREIIEAFVNEVVVSLERGSALEVTLKGIIPFRPESATRQPAPGHDGNRGSLWQSADRPRVLREHHTGTVQILYRFPFPPQPKKLASVTFKTG